MCTPLDPAEIARRLEDLRRGDSDAIDRLVPLLYDDLRILARQWLRKERSGHTLNTTALVHEAYLKLSDQYALRAEDRAQFLAAAGNTMRRILVDYARTRTRKKRGGTQRPIPLEDVEEFLSDREAEEMLLFHEALGRLEAVNPEGANVVQLRFFAGLTEAEIAQQQDVSARTVRRQWSAARAWLRKEMNQEPG